MKKWISALYQEWTLRGVRGRLIWSKILLCVILAVFSFMVPFRPARICQTLFPRLLPVETHLQVDLFDLVANGVSHLAESYIASLSSSPTSERQPEFFFWRHQSKRFVQRDESPSSHIVNKSWWAKPPLCRSTSERFAQYVSQDDDSECVSHSFSHKQRYSEFVIGHHSDQ